MPAKTQGAAAYRRALAQVAAAEAAAERAEAGEADAQAAVERARVARATARAALDQARQRLQEQVAADLEAERGAAT